MSNIDEFNREITILNIKKRAEQQRVEEIYRREIGKLYKKHNRPPKNRASKEELIIMVELVLRTGVSGTKAIQWLETNYKKPDGWKKDVTNSKPKQQLTEVLDSCKDFHIMKKMIEDNIYCEKDIINNTLTGALKKLSNQVKLCNLIESLRDRIIELESNLAAKNNKEEWHSTAIRLREEGYSYQKIAKSLGIGKSTVADFFKKINSKK